MLRPLARRPNPVGNLALGVYGFLNFLALFGGESSLYLAWNFIGLCFTLERIGNSALYGDKTLPPGN